MTFLKTEFNQCLFVTRIWSFQFQTYEWDRLVRKGEKELRIYINNHCLIQYIPQLWAVDRKSHDFDRLELKLVNRGCLITEQVPTLECTGIHDRSSAIWNWCLVQSYFVYFIYRVAESDLLLVVIISLLESLLSEVSLVAATAYKQVSFFLQRFSMEYVLNYYTMLLSIVET